MSSRGPTTIKKDTVYVNIGEFGSLRISPPHLQPFCKPAFERPGNSCANLGIGHVAEGVASALLESVKGFSWVASLSLSRLPAWRALGIALGGPTNCQTPRFANAAAANIPPHQAEGWSQNGARGCALRLIGLRPSMHDLARATADCDSFQHFSSTHSAASKKLRACLHGEGAGLNRCREDARGDDGCITPEKSVSKGLSQMLAQMVRTW